LFLALPVLAARVGEAAPAFTATDSNGHQYSLTEYKGKFVVLEWHNQGCPYVGKHYGSGNMQNSRSTGRARGNLANGHLLGSGEQGYVTAEQENDYLKKMNAAPTAVLLDPKGELGHLYRAKTTPTCLLSILKVSSSTMGNR